MAFGKRGIGVRSTERTPAPPLSIVALETIGEALPLDGSAEAARARHRALRDDLRQLHGDAALLADVIREREALDPVALMVARSPEDFPLRLTDFERHFSHVVNGTTLLSVFCLAPREETGAARPLLQAEFVQLFGDALALNQSCLAAHTEGALSILLQSADVWDRIDAIIVRSAVAAALVAVLAPDPIDGSACDDDGEAIVTAIARARARLLVPEDFERRIPKLSWPVTVSERIVARYPGARTINGVYVPEDFEVDAEPSAPESCEAVPAAGAA